MFCKRELRFCKKYITLYCNKIKTQIKSDKERGVIKSSLFLFLNSAQTALAQLNASQISVMPTKLGGPHMQGLRNRENLVTPLFPVKLFGSALYVRNKS